MSDSRRSDVEEDFGIDVFNDEAMRHHLSEKVYKALMQTIKEGKELDESIADEVSHGMKDWAISKGATHYTHWFQPLTSITAEKHDSFISVPQNGKVIMSFSGKELIKGEPDASSFPSGGLRSTFEARGYTAWDCTSPAFVMHDKNSSVLFIPTAFCSYKGEALDEKTPLLRSSEFVSKEALRVLRLFGDTTSKRVIPMVGPEQEYFLIDAEHMAKRKDLIYTGRTLFGAEAPKGQELSDHYFGPIRDKIASFMSEVNWTLWKLGVPAKTEHNEVAPSQHELAVIYAPVSIAADQNALVMMILKKVAKKHGLICLTSEKPFNGINGSGKHNNWSLQTDTGINLMNPGKTEEEKERFLAFLAATVKGVDEYAELLRSSVATYSNDFRLGANEAPPAIISIFLGDALTEGVNNIIAPDKMTKKKGSLLLETGAKTLPVLPKDSTDRNRTSPFAFTGNRFEFRMVGSDTNIAEPDTVLNTILGEELKQLADYAEKAKDPKEAVSSWVKDALKDHSRVIFNGDGYSAGWVKEAEERGLPNLKTTVEATDALKEKKIVDLFNDSEVLSESELNSRIEIKYSTYASEALIEAKTMSHMVHKLYLPCANDYLSSLVKEIKNFKDSGMNVPSFLNEKTTELISLIEEENEYADKLDEAIKNIKGSSREKAVYSRDVILPLLIKVRKPVDEMELIVPKDKWPVPSYGDLLFHIN